MILCFGIFASILKLGKADAVSGKQLLGTMTRTVDPNCKYIEKGNDTSVSRLYKCTANFPINDIEPGIGATRKPGETLSQVLPIALTKQTSDIVESFSNDVVIKLNEDKKKTAVLALLDVIANDKSLEEEHADAFRKYVGMDKAELLSQSSFDLPAFLAGLFLYCVTCVQNTAGKHFIDSITQDYFDSFESRKNEITLLPHIAERSKKESSLSSDKIESYLAAAKDKYSKVKTILYKEQPKDFYDLYVCNNLSRMVRVQEGRHSYYRCDIVKDADISKLQRAGNYIIISGTGGLGKSMMMRHLMLQAIDNYASDSRIPIFVPLKDYTSNYDNLVDYVYEKVKSLSEIAYGNFKELLSNGNAILLFDGLDEISSKHIQKFENDLDAFTDKYFKNMFVISSRPISSFSSYSRFTVYELRPLLLQQAVEVIEKLEFHEDEPSLKEKFIRKLKSELYDTHRAFAENPLLLTIMLITFDQYAEVPSKMHIFYNEAYLALAQRHDAMKVGYQRIFKTGLSADRFADYFAEFCSRTYYEEKFELTRSEFIKCFNSLKEGARNSNENVNAVDFLDDVCTSLCLMYYESGKYHFIHRSFQEYFCALYFSKQKDKTLRAIGDFFEHRPNRNNGENTFSMLYDMIPDKIDEYVFLPFLDDLVNKCEAGNGYWTYLVEMYKIIYYTDGETDIGYSNSPMSFLYDMILCIFNIVGYDKVDKDIFDRYEEFETDEFVNAIVLDENDRETDEVELVNRSDVSNSDLIEEYDVGHAYEFDVADILDEAEEYEDLISDLDHETFPLKKEYRDMVALRDELKERFSKKESKNLFDLF